LLMGLALTPFLFMGLALTPCLCLGLALYPICRIWFPDCTSKKKKTTNTKITEGISVAHLSTLTKLVSKIQRCVSACHCI
jgi:hypothetical protein